MDPACIEVEERADPGALGPGDARIDVAAAGVNFADVMARIGVYPDAPPPPCVVGYEVAGTLVELGSEVTGLQPGDRVVAGTKFGGYASQVVVPAADVVPLPDRLNFEQGAAIPVNYSTAWAALIGYGNLQPDERVLIHSAAGGVGIAATQIARRAGAEVWGAASPAKHGRIAELGVQHPVDYTKAGWEKGLPPFDVDPRRDRRAQLPRQLRPARGRRATRRVRGRGRACRASGATSCRRCAPSCACRASTS